MASSGSTITSTTTSHGAGSPCGACKFLRRKCSSNCIFAPYFCSEQGPSRFAAIHKVFGASNVSKLLLHIPVADRCEAVVTIAYEAQARIRDPVYGCVAHIFALQQQVTCLQAQLMQVKAQMGQTIMNSGNYNIENYTPQVHNTMFGNGMPSPYQYQGYYPNCMNSMYPQGCFDSAVDYKGDVGINMAELQSKDEQLSFQAFNNKKRQFTSTDLSELQALAIGMMKN